MSVKPDVSINVFARREEEVERRRSKDDGLEKLELCHWGFFAVKIRDIHLLDIFKYTKEGYNLEHQQADGNVLHCTMLGRRYAFLQINRS